MRLIQKALTFDDVLLVPAYSAVLPRDTQLGTQLTRDISINIPLVSAAMDTVTEGRLAIVMAQEGGIGIIHKNLTPAEQAREVAKVKRYESGVLRDPITISPDMTVRDVIHLSKEHGFSGFPVLQGKKVVGIITNRDLRFEEDLDAKVSEKMTPKDRLVTIKEGSPPEEAKRLGLKLTPVDERMDYEKSTQAAATILRESFAEFGDWLLVVAAYNGGAGRVRQAIKKKGTKDFWIIQYDLPLETRNHVKKFIATQYIFETEQYESNQVRSSLMKMKKSDRNTSNESFDVVIISGRYQLAIIAKMLSINLQFLQENNPGIEKLLASGKSYELKLPKGMLEKFEARKNEILQASLNALFAIDN